MEPTITYKQNQKAINSDTITEKKETTTICGIPKKMTRMAPMECAWAKLIHRKIRELKRIKGNIKININLTVLRWDCRFRAKIKSSNVAPSQNILCKLKLLKVIRHPPGAPPIIKNK
jgi:hypothetical protein